MGIAIWILLGSIAIIIYLIIYTSKSESRKRHRILVQAVAEAASQNSLEWTQVDFDRDRVTAWCAPKGILFFMDFTVADGNKHLIHTVEVDTCRIVNHYGLGADKKPHIAETNITRIELQLVFTDKRTIVLLVYDEFTDGLFEKIRLSEKAKNLKALISKEKSIV